MEQHQTFGPDPSNVAAARRFVETALEGSGLDSSDVCLLTSELVTNAVLHGGTELSVAVKLLDQRVRVEVTDQNPRLPDFGTHPSDGTTGRGLWLVKSVAEAWGVDRTPFDKTVWFEVVGQLLASRPDG